MIGACGRGLGAGSGARFGAGSGASFGAGLGTVAGLGAGIGAGTGTIMGKLEGAGTGPDLKGGVCKMASMVSILLSTRSESFLVNILGMSRPFGTHISLSQFSQELE